MVQDMVTRASGTGRARQRRMPAVERLMMTGLAMVAATAFFAASDLEAVAVAEPQQVTR